MERNQLISSTDKNPRPGCLKMNTPTILKYWKPKTSKKNKEIT